MPTMTATDWLAELFEYQLCAECGRDADQHTVCLTPLGTFFARCNDPLITNDPDSELEGRFAEWHAAHPKGG